jgi:hypothetical protein
MIVTSECLQLLLELFVAQAQVLEIRQQLFRTTEELGELHDGARDAVGLVGGPCTHIYPVRTATMRQVCLGG